MSITIGGRTVLAKTCLICGVLKMANQFALLQKKYRDSYCRSCHNAHSRPGMKQHQHKALNGARKHREPWSDLDLERLEKMAAEGRTGPEMALILNRSVYSVYTMKNKLDKGIR